MSDSAELLLVEGGTHPFAIGLDGVEIGIISEDSLENEVNILSLDWHEWVGFGVSEVSLEATIGIAVFPGNSTLENWVVDALEESSWVEELVEGSVNGHLSCGNGSKESDENGLVHLDQ